MTPEDIKDWLGLEVTKEFFERITLLRVDADTQVHANLKNNNLTNASFWNAGKDQLEEVLELPERMIKEAEEEK